ncbi:hypothetical protein Tco_1214590 [Tanacetum coccineum]
MLQGRNKYKRKKGLKGKCINTGLEFEVQVSTGFEDVSTSFNVDQEINTSSLEVNTGSGPVSTASIKVLIPSPNRKDKAIDKQVHLDALLAKRIAEEQELTEQQKQRKSQVQFEAQHYTKEDWDAIRAKLEANAKLTKSILGKDVAEEYFAKKMVELVNQRKKFFVEERAKARRSKPMTQSQLRTYMTNYLKNQGTWKLTQLKKLSSKEVKEEFDKLAKQIESFIPMSFEGTKAKEKVTEVKEEEPLKKIGKRRKQIARKGLHSKKTDKDETEKDEASEKDDPTSGTNVPINPVPIAVKPPSVANYTIIKQGKKGVYQIVRENGFDKIYINFGAMLRDISRDDLTELYRIVMKKHSMNEPEDEYEKVFGGYLKTMFDAPLSTDPIWSLPERNYPLSAKVCKAVLDKKFQGGKENEDCYQLLKRMEKQAGIKKD